MRESLFYYLKKTDKYNVERIILHPDTLTSKIGRTQQLELLAKSLCGTLP